MSTSLSAVQHNGVQRLNHHAILNQARRRGRGRLAFLRPGRTGNIAAVVRPQAALPTDSIAPPPSDAVQARQWQSYLHGRPAEINSNHGAPTNAGDQSRSHHGTPVELDASGPQVYQLHGEDVAREADRLQLQSPVSPISHSTNLSGSQSSPISIENTRNGTAAFVQHPPQSGASIIVAETTTAGLNSGALVGFDCPIRAGPDGSNKCTWPPRRDIAGFPSLARMREHVGSHGLLCPDCDKVFPIPTRYRDHRKNKEQTGVCSNLGEDKSSFPKHLAITPDTILAFFARPPRGVPERDTWLNGYKILHPGWEYDGGLPHPFYRDNVVSSRSSVTRDTSHNDLHSGAQDRSSTEARCVAPDLHEQSMHPGFDSSTAGPDCLTLDLDRQYLDTDMAGDFQFAQVLDEMTFINDLEGLQQPPNHASDGGPLMMSGGLPAPYHVTSGANELQDHDFFELAGGEASRTIQGRHVVDTGWDVPDQPQSEDADVSNSSSSQRSFPTSLHRDQAETNPYRQRTSHQEDRDDSAMELCETGNSCGKEAEELVKTYLAHSATKRGKQPVKHIVANTPARKHALKRIEKLMSQVEELYTKIQTLNSENRSLHVKIGEVEDEKQKLLITLMKIRMEVDMWDLDDDDRESIELDERIDSLGRSMQNIKLLLPD